MNFPEHYVRKLKNGDRKAFQMLYSEMFPKLCAFANKYINDREVSIDIVQDVFVRIWDHRTSIRSNTSFSSFLFVTVKNASINYLRKQKSSTKLHQDYTSLNSDTLFEFNKLEQDVFATVYDYIQSLPKRSREIMLLTLNGVSNDEIRTELGISVNTVKTLKKHSYRKMREKFKNLLYLIYPLLILLCNTIKDV
ncbi:RNA polymerase sigma-70 factor [Marinifilum sp. RC60d5]|uniref:RNA polymerase sigma-70 factor n=1 Tax=Marinifilum sp. RC60d5 TaxID=3458414 RepID=UPI0040353418